MRKFPPWAALLGLAVFLTFSSCTYDPYHSASGGYRGSDYGDGYGYGGSSFSTSLFVSTGDPRWGYDPSTYCYYDYNRRCYYDPYLYGYYPIGYRPPKMIGTPHPQGWRPGQGHCPPPRTVRNVTVANYRDREAAYRNSNYSWAPQAKQRLRGNSYRQPEGAPTSYGIRQKDSRSDPRTRPEASHGSYRPQSRPTWGSPTRQMEPAPRSSREPLRPGNYRSMDRPMPQQAAPRQVRPEPARFSRQQPADRLPSSRQFDRMPQTRGNGTNPRMQQAPPSNPPPPRSESSRRPARMDERTLRGLRGLGQE